MINTILHLGYPEKYERIISKRHKQKITDEFKEYIDENIKEEGNIDDKLYFIRTSLEKNLIFTFQVLNNSEYDKTSYPFKKIFEMISR